MPREEVYIFFSVENEHVRLFFYICGNIGKLYFPIKSIFHSKFLNGAGDVAQF